MKIKNQVQLQRLIAKIDNDFNISESDWIPRVAAWTIDALSQMKCLPMEKVKRKVEVSNRIAQYPCKILPKELKVFSKDGCEIEELNENRICTCRSQSDIIDSEFGIMDPSNKTGINMIIVADVKSNSNNHNFVLNGNSIELNFDTDFIYVESFEVATYHDDYYDCDVPYIYDNGLLLEALAWYVLYKYLSRGSKHPVYSLTSTNQVINPYVQWTSLKSRAAASTRIDLQKHDEGWNNFFYNSTFLPRG